MDANLTGRGTSTVSIDFDKEDILTFSGAARYAGPGRNGRPTHVATVHRWAMNGCRGIYLEWIQDGVVRK